MLGLTGRIVRAAPYLLLLGVLLQACGGARGRSTGGAPAPGDAGGARLELVAGR